MSPFEAAYEAWRCGTDPKATQEYPSFALAAAVERPADTREMPAFMPAEEVQ
jgi:hypothetical protein